MSNESDIGNLIENFITDKKYKYSVYNSLKEEQKYKRFVYNEFSFQHELGCFLREKLGNEYLVKFEYNINDFYEILKDAKKVNTCKTEIDIVIFKNEKEEIKEIQTIELKYLKNKAFPYRMFQCVKDMKFMNDILKISNLINKTYCVVITENEGFYLEKNDEETYNITDKVYKAYEHYVEELEKRKNELNKDEDEDEVKEIENIIKAINDGIINNKSLPTIYKYFRNPHNSWKDAKYIYSNLANRPDLIYVGDFKMKNELKWKPINSDKEDETNKYYILEFGEKNK